MAASRIAGKDVGGGKSGIPGNTDFAAIVSRSALAGTAKNTRLSVGKDGVMQYVDSDIGNIPSDARVVGLRTLHDLVKSDADRSMVRRHLLRQMALMRTKTASCHATKRAEAAAVSRIAGKDITDEQATDLDRLFRQLTKDERGYDSAYGLKTNSPSKARFIRWLRSLDSVYVSNDDSGRPIGMLTSTGSRSHDNANTIGSFVVDSGRRGSGVGRELLMQAIRDNVAAKRKSTLWVSNNNPAGIHLYESVGFKPVASLMAVDTPKHAVKTAGLDKRAFLTSMLTGLYRSNQQSLAPMARDSYDPYARYVPRTSGRTNPAIEAYQRKVQTTNGMTRPGEYGTAARNSRQAQLAQTRAWGR